MAIEPKRVRLNSSDFLNLDELTETLLQLYLGEDSVYFIDFPRNHLNDLNAVLDQIIFQHGVLNVFFSFEN